MLGPTTCSFLAGFGPTLTLVVLALVYMVLSRIIQHRLHSRSVESDDARNQYFSGHGAAATFRFIRFIFIGKIADPTTSLLRNIERVLIVVLLVAMLLEVIATLVPGVCRSYVLAP